MNDINSLSHSRWECKYHVVWIPKCRRKVLYGQLRKHLGEVFHELARQKESKVLEGHLQADHIHMLVSIPPKYAVAQVVGYMKGKNAIYIARTLSFAKTPSGRKFDQQWRIFQISFLKNRNSWTIDEVEERYNWKTGINLLVNKGNDPKRIQKAC